MSMFWGDVKRQMSQAIADWWAKVSTGQMMEQGIERMFPGFGTPEALQAAMRNQPNPIAMERMASGDYTLQGLLGEMLPGPDLPMGGLLGQTVWHGGRNAWERPSLAFAGEGEGGAAYGHGFYAADVPDVGKEYQKIASRRGGVPPEQIREYFQPGRVVQGYGGPDKVISFNEGKNPYDWSVTVQRVDKQGNPVRGEAPRTHRTSPDPRAFEKTMGRPPGYLYQMDLPDEAIAKMLNWDDPLSAQSKRIQDISEGLWKRAFPSPADVYEQFRPDVLVGADIYDLLKTRTGSQAKASSVLNAAGIPGIRYLDEWSRGFANPQIGNQTYNYVTFDPSILQLLQRFPQ